MTPSTLVAPDAGLKAKLGDIERELAAARDRRAAAVRERDSSRDAFANSRDLTANSPAFRKAKADADNLVALDAEIADLQAAQVATLKMLGQEAPAASQSAPAPQWGDPEGWDATNVLTDPVRMQLSAIASSSLQAGNRVALGQIIDRDALAQSFGPAPMAAAVTATENQRRGSYIGVVPPLRRELTVLDLIPTGTMDGKSVPYTQESGSYDTAAEVAEGNLKPEAAITLTDTEAVAATIAHWHKVNKQVLADAPALRSTLESRLRYGTLRRLQDEILAGSGTGANLRGILNTPGIGAVAYDGDELIADQILRGITTIHLADGQANGIVLNPVDWEDALLAKAAGDGHYYSGGPFAAQQAAMWTVPLIPSNAMPQGTALIGDFRRGAQLFIREGVNVLLSDSDQDDFLRNRVTLLAEMRAALAVFRPTAFCTVDLSA